MTEELQVIFAIPAFGEHGDVVSQRCFKDCGRIAIGGIVVADIPCFLCTHADCPYEESVTETIGESGMTGAQVKVRKLLPLSTIQ